MRGAARHPRCPHCGYDLTGLTEPRCPECGAVVSAADWQLLSQHGVLPPLPPAWERGRGRSLVGFGQTLAGMLVWPWPGLRGLRAEPGVLGAVGFVVLLAPVACVLCVAALIVLSQVHHYSLTESIEAWLHAVPGKFPLSRWAPWLGWKALLVAAFVATGVLVWLPTLVALDLVSWRRREWFRPAAKVLLYTQAWWALAGALAAGPVNDLLLNLGEDWYWGYQGGWSDAGVWPWPCWIGALLATVQYVTLLRVIRARESTWAAAPRRVRRTTLLVVTGGWLLAAYLLLLDWHVHLRFYLCFVMQEVYRLVYPE